MNYITKCTIRLVVLAGLALNVGQLVKAQNPPPPASTTARAVAWNSDGIWIARAFQNGIVDVIDSNTGQTVFTVNNGQSPATALAWQPGTGSIKLAAAISNSVYVWDIPNTQPVYALQANANVDSLDWTVGGGDKLAAASFNGPAPNLNVWDPLTGQAIFSTGISQLSTASWDTSGSQLVIGGGLAIEVVNLSTGQVQMLSQNSLGLSFVQAVAWSPDGTTIASSGVFGQVMLWNASDGQFVAYSEPSRSVVNQLSWSNDSTKLASASWDGTVRVWDGSNGVLLGVINPNAGRVFSVDWSPHDTRLVFGTENGDVQIFQLSEMSSPTVS